MVKILLIPTMLYCVFGFFIGGLTSDVNGIGSSISFAPASRSAIENSESFSHARAKRALALLVPFDDEDESSEEHHHHKIKRCWRGRPVQKTVRLTEETENDMMESARKRSVEKSDEEYSEDNFGGKFQRLRIVPVKNIGKNLKELLGTGREGKDNSEDLVLRKIKNQLNSDDYNVLALVGKRAGKPQQSRQRKYVCYCREANCSGGNCQRFMYRPCSSCRNYRPIFNGDVNRNYCADGRIASEDYKSEARMPLKIQYPGTYKNEFVRYPAINDGELNKNQPISSSINDVGEFGYRNYQQRLPVAQDRRYHQYSYDTGKDVLENRNNNNQWTGNSRYSGTENKMDQLNRQNFNELCHGNTRLVGSRTRVPIVQGIAEVSRNLDTTEPKTTNLLPISTNVFRNKYYHDGINGFGWNMPNVIETQARPRQQHIQTSLIPHLHYNKEKSGSYFRQESVEEEENPQSDYKEINSASATGLDTENYTQGYESDEGNTDYEEINEHTEDRRYGYYSGVSAEPEKYELPLTILEKVNPSANQPVGDAEKPGYDHRLRYSVDETKFGTQLEQPEIEQSNLDDYKEHTTQELIIKAESNEGESYSTYDDQLKRPMDHEKTQFVEAEYPEEDYRAAISSEEEEESGKSTGVHSQATNNGYFTSEAHDHFGVFNNEGDYIPVVGEIDGYSHDVDTHRSGSNYVESDYEPLNQNQIESGSQDEDPAITANYFEDGKLDSFSTRPSGIEDLAQPSIGSEHRLLQGDNMSEIITHGNSTSGEREYSSESNEEAIESLEKTETPSTEAVAKEQGTDSGAGDNYGRDLTSGKSTLISNEESLDKTTDHSSSVSPEGNNSGEYFRPKSMESYEDVSYSDNGLRERYSEEVLSDKKTGKVENGINSYGFDQVGEKPADFRTENLPTKYFSPNDRVLEYIKKHSQNLAGYFDDQQRKTQLYTTSDGRESQYVTPATYHTEFRQNEAGEDDYRGFDSGSESDEIISRTSSDGNYWQDYNTSKEIDDYSGEQSTESNGADYIEGGDLGAAQEPRESTGYYYDSKESTEGSVVLDDRRETNEKTGITHTMQGISTYGYDYPDSTDNSRSTEETGISGIDYSTESLYPVKYTQYDEKEDAESVGDTISPCRHRVDGQKSSTESYYNDEKLLVGKFVDSSREKYTYTTEGTRKADDSYSINSNEAREESDDDYGEIKSAEFIGGSQSMGSCAKPQEVEDDAGYLGRIKPKKTNADVKSLGDLIDSDLYYIGDGVRLPLTIKKLKDGSFALSISDKICEQRMREECPCCVPREGRIVEEKHGEKSSSSLRRRAVPDGEESEIDDDRKTQSHRRTARSISTPVDEFADKYNLILNLNDELAESSLMNNTIQKDEARDDETEQEGGELVQKLVFINHIPDDEGADILLSTLEKIIATEPKEVVDVVDVIKKQLRGIKSADDDREGGVAMARYGYQRDNPILEKIKIIKQLQKEANKCERKYQKDCDYAITQKTQLLTMILYWLKDLVTGDADLIKD